MSPCDHRNADTRTETCGLLNPLMLVWRCPDCGAFEVRSIAAPAE